MQKVLRAVREQGVRHELRAVRAPVGRVRRGLGDEHLSRRWRRVSRRVRQAGLQLQSYNTLYAEDLKDVILDFNQLKRAEPETPDTRLLLAVNPSPADYEEFQALCENHAGAILMLNGRLEDAAVGIGSVARERRKGFVASWQQAYWLQPLEGGALMRCFPDDWRLYRQDPDGFRQLDVLSERPDPDTTSALLAGEDPDSIKQQLSGVDRFLDGLRN